MRIVKRKPLRKLLTLLGLSALMAISTRTEAQVGLYTFAASSGTYTPITGGTQLNASIPDSWVSSAIALSPAFTFNGTSYSTAYVTSNGLLTLGGSAPSSSEYNAIANNTGSGMAICPFNADLNGSTATGAAPEIRFQTVGSEHIFQWKDAQRYNVGDRFNFQLRLNAATGAIVMVYGGGITVATSTSYQPVVGIRNAATAGNYKNLKVTATGTETWAAPLLGTTNTDNLRFTSATTNPKFMVDGQTYTFNPPPPCSGAPTAGTIASATLSGCVGSSTTLTVSGYTPQATGVSLQWQSSTTSTTAGFSDIAGATTSSYTTPVATATGNTYYRVKVTCGTTDSSFATAVTYTIAAPTTTVATLPYNQSFENWISTCGITDRPGTEWLMQPFNSDSAWRRHDQGASAGWSSTSGLYSPAFTAGASSARFHTFNTSSGRSGAMLLNLDMSQSGSKIISFDHINTSGSDSLFVELSTNGGTSYTLLGGYGTASAWTRRTLVSSATAASAILRFRARSDFGGSDIGLDSLNIFVTNCLPVTSAPTVSAISNNSATITWAAASTAPSNGYDYYVSTSSTTPAFTQAPTGSVTTGLTANLTGLSANTTYYVWVRGNCGSGTSIWSPSATFTTQCNPIASFPYTEGFETVGIPSCWSTELISGTTNWTSNTSVTQIPAPVAGSRFMWKYWGVSTANLYSPSFNLSSFGTTQARINLWIYRTSVGSANDSIQFAVNTSKSFTGATPLLTVKPLYTAAPAVSAAGWYNYTANIPVSFNTTTPAYILIQGNTTSSASSWDLGIDSFRLELVPTCAPPTNVTVSAINPTGTTINWVAPTTTTPTSYRWEVRSSGQPGSGSTGLAQFGTVAVPTLTTVVTGLTSVTTYRVYVRSYCGTSDSSAWSFPVPQFTTPASCSVPTPAATTGITPNTANLAWTNGTFGSATNWQISYGVTGTTAAAGTKVNVTTNPYTLGGLVPATGYVYFVRSACSPGDTSAWSSSQSFTTAPTCSVPTTLIANSPSTTTVNLGWTAGAFGGATSWQISYGVTGTTAANGTKVIAPSNPYTLSGLTPATAYVYFVRSICSPGDTSAWSSSLAFTTLCNPSTLPFAENFNTILPNLCWSRANGLLAPNSTLTAVTSNNWISDQYMNVGSNNAARNNLYQSGNRQWLVSPSIDLGSASGNFIVEFNMGVTAYASATLDTLGSDDTVAVVVSYNNGTTWSSANALRVWTAADGTIPGQRYYFPINGSGQIKIGFYGSDGVIDNVDDNDIFFDSLRVTQCIAPALALGNDTTLCGGGSLTLNAGVGTRYIWSTGDSSQSIVVSNAGSYAVTVINGSPGCFRRDTINVNTGLIPVVALGPDTAVCGNVGSFQLNAGNPGSNYAWSSPTIPQLSGLTTQVIDLGPVINAANSGLQASAASVIATVTNASGCVGRDTVNVSVVFTARVSDFTISGTDPTFTFTPVQDTFANVYAWTFGDGSTASTPNPSHTYTINGSYTVTLTVGNQCGITDTVTKTRPVTSGVKGVVADDMTIMLYPNPTAADAVLTVEGGAKLRGYQVLNAAGAVVASRTLDGGMTRATVNTSAFAPGVYTLRIQLDKGVVVRKLEVLK